MSTILTPCFKGLEVFRDFIAPTPQVTIPPLRVYIGVVGLFRVVEVWKLDGCLASTYLLDLTNENNDMELQSKPS